MICERPRRLAAPELEIDIFDGKPMDFHYFMTVFKEVVENKMTDSRGRQNPLIRFTKQEVKKIAKKYIQLSSVYVFKTTKRLLTERFRDPHMITASYRKDIKQ